ncbi:MAG: hypothetical protein CVV17_12220, partial [Gammaproteobacteria bacterium HGW-Gammaproteobacteria-7]
GGTVRLRILSNLADRRLTRAKAVFPKEVIGGAGAVDGIVEAWAFADADPYRAATHNKGIMNGIDAAAIACGQDWRAIEAGAHAYAARGGRYHSLTRWHKDKKGNLVGEIELPMAVGIVGGAVKAHPTARICTKILGIKSAKEFAEILAAPHPGKLGELATVPHADTLPGLAVHRHPVLDVETIAGGADQIAGPARQATPLQFFPDRVFVADRHERRQLVAVEVQPVGKSRPLLRQHLIEQAHLAFTGAMVRGVPGQQRLARWRADLHSIPVAQVREVQVEPLAGRQRPHALAEAVLVARGQAFDSDDQRRGAALQIVLVALPRGEHRVQQMQGMDVARVDAEDDPRPRVEHGRRRHP